MAHIHPPSLHPTSEPTLHNLSLQCLVSSYPVAKVERMVAVVVVVRMVAVVMAAVATASVAVMTAAVAMAAVATAAMAMTTAAVARHRQQSTNIGSKDMVAVATAMETAAAGAATTAVGAPTTAPGVGTDRIAFATAWEGCGYWL